MMRFIGRLKGGGMLMGGGEAFGRAEFELDGFVTRPGEVVASGELRVAAEALSKAFGRRDLSLVTDDGRVLSMRFSGRRPGASGGAAHVDVVGDLPPEKEWRR